MVAASRAWLDDHNGEAEPELGLCMLKTPASCASTHSRQAVADALGDVVFTALVAADGLGYDPC